MDCGMEKTCGGTLVSLFLTFLKIGACTFGGGYGMLRLLEDTCIEKRHWLDNDEFLGMVAMAESTPGPIAINAATYIGYKRAGIRGAMCATVAVCVPSFVLLYLISLFFDRFLEIALVNKAFRGIQCAVCYLIFSAGLKLVRGMGKSRLEKGLFFAVLAVMTLLTLLSVSFSSIYDIVICGAVGVLWQLVRGKRGGM